MCDGSQSRLYITVNVLAGAAGGRGGGHGVEQSARVRRPILGTDEQRSYATNAGYYHSDLIASLLLLN